MNFLIKLNSLNFIATEIKTPFQTVAKSFFFIEMHNSESIIRKKFNFFSFYFVIFFRLKCRQALESLQEWPKPFDRFHWCGTVEEAKAPYIIHTASIGIT